MSGSNDLLGRTRAALDVDGWSMILGSSLGRLRHCQIVVGHVIPPNVATRAMARNAYVRGGDHEPLVSLEDFGKALAGARPSSKEMSCPDSRSNAHVARHVQW